MSQSRRTTGVAAKVVCCRHDIYIVACNASFYHQLATCKDKHTNAVTVMFKLCNATQLAMFVNEFLLCATNLWRCCLCTVLYLHTIFILYFRSTKLSAA